MELMPGRVLDTPAIVSWKFPNNRFGSLEVVYSPQLQIETSYYAQDDRIEITGTKGVIWINGGHGRLTDAPPVTLARDGRTRTFDDIPTGWEQSFIHATRHLIDALHDNTPPRLTGDRRPHHPALPPRRPPLRKHRPVRPHLTGKHATTPPPKCKFGLPASNTH